jgi:radical SAM protein with 4Fe4S-binding SPASM domain
MIEPLDAARIFHYERLEGEWPTRFHLRVDPDGAGVLLANASEAANLSPVGVVMARMLLEADDEGAVRAAVNEQFARVPEAQLTADIAAMRQLLAELSQPSDNYPITDLADPDATGFTRALAAPLRADLVQGDPATADRILRKLWDAAIPHVTILARPDMDAADLPLLVETAEDLGMICGIRAVASWLSPEVIEQAAMAGLDHLDLLFVSPDAGEHDALAGAGDLAKTLAAFEQCRALELCPVAEVPLMDANADIIDEVMAGLREIGISNAIFFALACADDDAAADAAGALPARALPQVATVMVEASEEERVRYLWAPPVWFDADRSPAEQVQAGPRTAGDVAIRVEADGSVLPPRGRGDAGNILAEPWEDIWDHDSFARYRERTQAPPRCADCPDLAICATGCPKDPSGWSDDREGGAAL